MYNSGRGSSSHSEHYRYTSQSDREREKPYSRDSRRDRGSYRDDDKDRKRKRRWDDDSGSSGRRKEADRSDRSRSPVRDSYSDNREGKYKYPDPYDAEKVVNPPKKSNNWSDSSSDEGDSQREYRRKRKDCDDAEVSSRLEKNNNTDNFHPKFGLDLGFQNDPQQLLPPHPQPPGGFPFPSFSEGLRQQQQQYHLSTNDGNSNGNGLKVNSSAEEFGSSNTRTGTPASKAYVSNSAGIQIKLLPQIVKPTPAVPSIKPKSMKIASVFNVDDDDDEEEMPAECKMRMKNIGRDTPTSAGPNSFGKTKIGFCNVIQIKERKLEEELLKKK